MNLRILFHGNRRRLAVGAILALVVGASSAQASLIVQFTAAVSSWCSVAQ